MRIHLLGAFVLAVLFAGGPAIGGVPSFARAQSATMSDRELAPGANPWIVYFSGRGDAYEGKSLYLLDRADGSHLLVGRADPYERPILSADHERLLYVQVRSIEAFPGAQWSLLVYDRSLRQSRVIARANGMALAPLGWQSGAPLYTLAGETQTGIYRVSRHRSMYVSFLFTEPFTQPSLAPGGEAIAFVTPADCSWCTLSIFSLTTLTSWFGPTGVPSKDTLAWSADGSILVTVVKDRLVAIDVPTHQTRQFQLPSGLSRIWHHPMRVTFAGSRLRLVDAITGRVYLARPARS